MSSTPKSSLSNLGTAPKASQADGGPQRPVTIADLQDMEARLRSRLSADVEAKIKLAKLDAYQSSQPASDEEQEADDPSEESKSSKLPRSKTSKTKKKPPKGGKVSSALKDALGDGVDDGGDDDDQDVDSSSSSPSHSSDEEQETKTKARSKPKHQKRMARKIVKSVKGDHGSFKKWVQGCTWRTDRNRREAMSLARAMDAFIKEGIPTHSEGVEIIVRRLVGVQLADEKNNWTFCTSMEWGTIGHSLIDMGDLSDLIKTANRLEKLDSVPQPAFKDKRTGKPKKKSDGAGARAE